MRTRRYSAPTVTLPGVDKMRTPLLIMHGEQDPQVPPQESQEFVAALKSAGKTYEYVTYPTRDTAFVNPAISWIRINATSVSSEVSAFYGW